MGETGPVERVPDRRRLVGRQVVHDHKRVAPVPQRGHEHLLDKGQEHGRAGRGSDAHGRDHTAERERTDDGQPLPAPARDPADSPPPAWGAAVDPGHPGVAPALVEEDEAARIEAGQLLPPRRPRLGDVLPLLLGGPERLFFRAKPRPLSARQTEATLRRTPVRTASWSAYSASVASFLFATKSDSTAAWPSSGARPRTGGLGPRRPSVRAAFSQSKRVEAATRKRRAIASRVPSRHSQADRTRSRRSVD